MVECYADEVVKVVRFHLLQQINGVACTKAGVSPLQGESGEFDSHLLHLKFFNIRGIKTVQRAAVKTGKMDSISIYSTKYGSDGKGSPSRLHRECSGSIPAVSTKCIYNSAVQSVVLTRQRSKVRILLDVLTSYSSTVRAPR